MKFFGRNQDKDNEEKPIVFYYAIGVLGSNKSLPVDQESYVHVFEDRIDIKLLKSKGGMLLSSKGEGKITIPYRNMLSNTNILRVIKCLNNFEMFIAIASGARDDSYFGNWIRGSIFLILN